MGAQSFSHEVFATSPQQGFNILHGEATYRYGNDPYNGSINTCHLGSKQLSFDKYTETREKQAYKQINDTLLSASSKYDANYVDLGVVEYQVITYKKVSDAGAPKYKLGFVVKRNGETISKLFATKTEAMDTMLGIAIKEGSRDLYVAKEYIRVEGRAQVGHIETEVKRYKTRPNLKANPNRVIKEIHKYIFFGWAGC